MTESKVITVLATTISADTPAPTPNPVEASNYGVYDKHYIDGTVVITFKNTSTSPSSDISVTLTQFTNTNFLIQSYKIDDSTEVTENLTTPFSLGYIPENGEKNSLHYS